MLASSIRNRTEDLTNFYRWSVSNKLTVNTAKSKFFYYSSTKQGNFLEGRHISLNGKDLEFVTQYVYLGVRLNNLLNFNDHLKHLYSSALQMFYSLYKIRKFIDCKSAVTIFKSFILSRLEYGSIFGIESNASTVRKLQKLVNKCLRICFKLPRDSNVFDMHTHAKLLPLCVRRNIQLMKLMFKCLFCSTPKDEGYKRSVAFQGPSRWDKLPLELKLLETIEEFDREIKEYYLVNFLAEGVV